MCMQHCTATEHSVDGASQGLPACQPLGSEGILKVRRPPWADQALARPRSLPCTLS